MQSPYNNLPKKHFWRLAVPEHASGVEDLYVKRFSISGKKIATAGSCFAQEIAKGLRKNNYTVVDKEPSPGTYEVRAEIESRFGYGLYSARHGNIYTARQLLQLTKEALGKSIVLPDEFIWEKDGRYFDALRPSVEPNGLPSKDEVVLQRQEHLKRFKQVLEEADVFVFTFGLTEAWVNKKTELVYPTAPGTIAGSYSEEDCEFVNFRFQDIYNDFMEFRSILKEINENIKFIITVSPVPLTATASKDHVLVATVRSKSTLRAVTAQIYDDCGDVDYFPSYEFFSTPFLGGSLFQENKRNVSRAGVQSVMKIFFSQHNENTGEAEDFVETGAVVCEEALLEAFAGSAK